MLGPPKNEDVQAFAWSPQRLQYLLSEDRLYIDNNGKLQNLNKFYGNGDNLFGYTMEHDTLPKVLMTEGRKRWIAFANQLMCDGVL